MFGLFKKKSEAERLQEKFNKLMAEWHKLSSINRTESDKKYAEAQVIAQRIDSLKS
ncbi:Lacal_2735 family protein [Flaviramulus sp. BrNp1-15]|uniref:Lacal_2735 family protein n=1 Tax=Flaviramulus sp. BrNp1-15 TaxID=2916754 RepID=UPI001EE8C0FD|nr:Lacal_2735 family protein [Flaviramulus sp. BrNp1-15]ULC58622.1 Lacal_2735 family protein [Flaviramulus sp. BrNp1-15]